MKKPIIIQKTSDFIAIDKPPGWLTIAGRDPHSAKPILVNWLQDELKTKIYILHRLDEGTSGIILFALNPNFHKTMNAAFEHGEVKKTYLAVIQGTLENQIIDAPIYKLPSKKNKSVVSIEKGKPSQTIIKTVQFINDLSLLEVTPLTGRTHQIRVHLNHLKHPILGDKTYGGLAVWNNHNFHHPLLQAIKLEFLDFKIEVPKANFISGLGFI